MRFKHLNLYALFLLFLSSFCSFDLSAHLPDGFSDQLVFQGNGNTRFIGLTFDDNGRMFCWRKSGRVHIIEADGTLIEEAVLDISEEVGNYGDHGLLGFTLDPDFLNNGLVYGIYTVDRHHLLYYGTPAYSPFASVEDQATIIRVTRWQLDPENDFKSTVEDSRFVLIGETLDTGIPVLHRSHGPGSVLFGSDGSLIVSAGDNTTFEGSFAGTGTSEPPSYVGQGLEDGILEEDEDIGAYRAQYLNSHCGKILRIDPETGDGLASNPFFNADEPRSAASRVWALGFRNPYRCILEPGTGSTNMEDGDPGTILVGDVGSAIYEELNRVTEGGQNFGWPIYEGYFWNWNFGPIYVDNRAAPNPLYESGGCDQEYFKFQHLIQTPSAHDNYYPNPCNASIPVPEDIPTFVMEWPQIAYANAFWNKPATAIVGTFEEGECEPSFYTVTDENSPTQGEDFGGYSSLPGFFYTSTHLNFPEEYHGKYFHGDYMGWLKVFDIDSNKVIKTIEDFLLDDGTNITSFVLNPIDGCIYYTDFTYDAIRKIGYNLPQYPEIIYSYDTQYGPAPLTVNFNAAGSFHPDGLDFDFLWNFGDGTTSTDMNPTHVFTASNSLPLAYNVSLTLTDEEGRSSSENFIISVNNTPPVVDITSFEDGAYYSIDGVTTLDLFAEVEDAEHSTASLKYTWQTFLHHNTHFHAEAYDTEPITDTRIHPYGCQDELYYYRIKLRVKDPAGLVTTVEQYIYPECGENFFSWTNFTAEADDNGVALNWSVDTELSDATFTIQAQKQGKLSFKDQGELSAQYGQNFSFYDEAPIFGTSTYRIKTTLGDGTVFYSDERIIAYPLNSSVQLFPNPTINGQVFFNLERLGEPENVQVQIYNIQGRLIDQFPIADSCLDIDADLSAFPNGIYFFRILMDDREQVIKLMKGE